MTATKATNQVHHIAQYHTKMTGKYYILHDEKLIETTCQLSSFEVGPRSTQQSNIHLHTAVKHHTAPTTATASSASSTQILTLVYLSRSNGNSCYQHIRFPQRNGKICVYGCTHVHMHASAHDRTFTLYKPWHDYINMRSNMCFNNQCEQSFPPSCRNSASQKLKKLRASTILLPCRRQTFLYTQTSTHRLAIAPHT